MSPNREESQGMHSGAQIRTSGSHALRLQTQLIHVLEENNNENDLVVVAYTAFQVVVLFLMKISKSFGRYTVKYRNKDQIDFRPLLPRR